MSWDDDEAYNREQDYQLTAKMHRKLKVDAWYQGLTNATLLTHHKLNAVDRFVAVCKDLVTGFRIAHKRNDAELNRRFWIVELLEMLIGIGSKGTRVSKDESWRMAKAFVPVVKAMAEWAIGRPMYEKTIDFQKGVYPKTLAAEIHANFVLKYEWLASEVNDVATCVHPVLFIPIKQENGVTTEYLCRTDGFLKLLQCCEIYQERNKRTEIDELFSTEMKKPFDERFFNVDDDEDEAYADLDSTYECAMRSRLKAYLRYRQEAEVLHRVFDVGTRNGFVFIESDLRKMVLSAREGKVETIKAKYGLMNIVNGTPQKQDYSWFDLLEMVVKMRPWIFYNDYDYSEEPDETVEWEECSVGRYVEVNESIPERDLCFSVQSLLIEYLRLIASMSCYIGSSTYANLSAAVLEYERTQGWLYTPVITDGKIVKPKGWPFIVSQLKDSQARLAFDLKMFKAGRDLLIPISEQEARIKSLFPVGAQPINKLESVHRLSESMSVKIDQMLEQSEATNARVQTTANMVRNFAKNGEPGKMFGIAEQKICYGYWLEDRKDPMLALDGHKPGRVDSFNKRKDSLAKIGVMTAAIYSTLIERYRKRTGEKIIKNRKSEKGKRKPALGNRKTASGTGKRNGKTHARKTKTEK